MPTSSARCSLFLAALAWPLLAAATGEEIYRSRCALCHDAGATGAPRVNRPEDWTARLAKGRPALHAAALRGIPNSAMTAKGGHVELSDAEVIAAVEFMLSGLPVAARAQSPAPPAPRALAAAKPGVRVDDDSLAAGVAEALRAHLAPSRSVERYEGLRIDGILVEARSGRVVLSGVVKDAATVTRAEQTALSVAGVSGVENKLIAAELFEHD